MREDIIYQIRRELEIHSHLRHENITQMYGFFFDKKRIYIIMEYVSGGELYKKFLDVRKFPEATVSVYIRQVASALSTCTSSTSSTATSSPRTSCSRGKTPSR